MRIIDVKVCGNHLSKDGKCAGVRGEANVSYLRISFDDSWDNYSKKVTFWDARGLNPVEIGLTPHFIEDVLNSTQIYLVPIPAEPMAHTGMLTFVVDGFADGKRQRSLSAKLEVEDAPITDEATQPTEPTPSLAEQVLAEIDEIKEDVVFVRGTREFIENIEVSTETLKTGEEAFVEKSEGKLHFGLPAGGKGDTGDSGVYIGENEPTDEKYNVWIDTSGEATDIKGFGSLMTSVTTFGAVGDGVTDDTEALRAAAESGEAVFFPAGTYILRGQIDMEKDINWCGEGAKSIIKLMPYDQSKPEEYNGMTVYNCYMINHPDGKGLSISLQGLVLDANKEDYDNDIYNNGSSRYDHTTCLDLHNPKSVYLQNVEIRNALVEGCYILARNLTDIRISDCNFHDNGFYQIDASGLHIEANCENAIITNCLFNNNGFHGLLLGGTTGATVSNISCCNNGWGGVTLWGGSSNNTLSGVYCKGNSYGVMFKSTYDSYYADDYYDNSWMTYASHNTITGLTTESNSFGVVFCNCEKNIISGWNCVKDYYAYSLGYKRADKPITGSVFGVFDYIVNEQHTENIDVSVYDLFQVQVLGR